MNATNPKVTPQHKNVKQASTMCPTNDWTSGGDCAEGVFSITTEVCCCCCCWEAGVNGCISSGWPASTVTTLGFITSCCQLMANKLHITPTFSYNWNQPKRWIVTNQKLPRMQGFENNRLQSAYTMHCLPPQQNSIVYGETCGYWLRTSFARRQHSQWKSWSTEAVPFSVASCWLTSLSHINLTIHHIRTIMRKHDIIHKQKVHHISHCWQFLLTQLR